MNTDPTEVKATKGRERFLVLVVILLVAAANIPDEILGAWHVERAVLIAALGLLIFLALFLYVRVFFFLLFVALILGANLPDQVAGGLGISPIPLLIALVVMVLASIINSMGMYIPTGTGVKRKGNPTALASLMLAIERRRLASVMAVLEIEFDLNQTGNNGLTPLMLAAQTGQIRIVEALLHAGAKVDCPGLQGTAVDMATRAGHTGIVNLLRQTTYSSA